MSEFLASNDTGRKDIDGEYSDWVEIHNAGAEEVNLAGWRLTDNAGDSSKWRFPAVSLAPGAHLVVFASGKDLTDPAGELHTNFKLGAEGEYLALIAPDGAAATEFAPSYPAQTPDVSYGLARNATGYTEERRYFLTPTPGAVNGTGTRDIGPVFSEAAHVPLRPAAGENITVTVRVTRALADVGPVRLRWICMFDSAANALKEVIMRDDGAEGDADAGDGVFTGVIPGTDSATGAPVNTFAAGRLIRWCFTAEDTEARASRWPLFADPVNSPEFLGTVAKDAANFTNPMPVWYWFAKNTSLASTETGTRGAVFFKNRLYDNIFIRSRGGATSTNSKKFDFNSGDHCYIDDTVGRVEEANLNISGQDSTLIRPPLAFEMFRATGHPACAAFPVFMRMANSPTSPASASYSDTTTYFVEQPDERFLERHGLDPEGALYKMNQKSNLDPVFTDAYDGVEKRTRKTENNNDLAAVCAALRKRSTDAQRTERATFMFDHFDLANMVNYLAVRAVMNDYDDVRKNFYIYRDTNGSREWLLLPWDKDGTLGVAGDGGTWLAHPFFGDLAHLKQNANQWSLLWEAVFNDPRTRAMYLRRLRTVMDEQLQPLTTPLSERYLEKRADAWGALFTPVRSASAIKSFLNQRRTQLYTTYATTSSTAANRLVPPAQPADAVISFGAVEANPADGQEAEYIELVNPGTEAVDISGWKIDGGITHVCRPGTVLRGNSSLFLARNAAAFRARASGPSGGQMRFVQGGWSGSLSARGEPLVLTDLSGRPAASLTTPANPTPAQSFLRVTKVMFAPAPGGPYAAGEHEYLELRNTGPAPLTLDGVFFDKGVTFAFPANSTLAAGGRLLLVKNAAAFAARHGAGLPVAGVFTGSLDNAGERLRLLDPSGEEILDFTYDPLWIPEAYRGGAALVAADENAPWTGWDTEAGWRESTTLFGTPGGEDPPPVPLPSLAPVDAGGARSLLITGRPGSVWTVQRSPDLADWSYLATVTVGTEGAVTFTDGAPPAFSAALFYRCTRP